MVMVGSRFPESFYWVSYYFANPQPVPNPSTSVRSEGVEKPMLPALGGLGSRCRAPPFPPSLDQEALASAA